MEKNSFPSLSMFLAAGSSLAFSFKGGGGRAFQHMASIAMLVICSDSQAQSLFIQLALLSNPDPQCGMHVWL